MKDKLKDLKDAFEYGTFSDKHPWIMSILIVTFFLCIIIVLALYWSLVRYVYHNVSNYVAIIMVMFPILVIMTRIKIL